MNHIWLHPMVKRVRNARGPSCPTLDINEPVTGSYCTPRPTHPTRSSTVSTLAVGFGRTVRSTQPLEYAPEIAGDSARGQAPALLIVLWHTGCVVMCCGSGLFHGLAS